MLYDKKRATRKLRLRLRKLGIEEAENAAGLEDQERIGWDRGRREGGRTYPGRPSRSRRRRQYDGLCGMGTVQEWTSSVLDWNLAALTT